jgi:UDP-glucose 4-epimerase
MANGLLLIGGAGFLGTALAAQLLHGGSRFTILSRSKVCPPRLGKLLESSKGLGEYVYGDSRDVSLVDHLVSDHNGVVYLAHAQMRGVTSTDASMELGDNLAAAIPVFSAAARHQTKVVLLSSGGTVYGQAGSGPIGTDHPLAPVSSYGLTKLAVENCASYFARAAGLRCVILRPGNAYGPGQIPFRGQGFVATAMATIMNGGTVRVFGRPGAVRDYVFVDDIANAILLACEKGENAGVYNVGSGRGLSNDDMLDHIEEIVSQNGLIVRREYAEARREDVPCNILDSTEFERATGWCPEVGIENGLEQTYAWLKEAP